MIRNIYIQVGHVPSCVVRNVSVHIEITDLKLYGGCFYKICRKNSDLLKIRKKLEAHHRIGGRNYCNGY